MPISEGDLREEFATTSTLNSTSSTLLANAVFTGTWEDVLDWNNLTILAHSDKASATSGVVLQWSNNGATVHHQDSFSLYSSVGVHKIYGRIGRYLRLVYTNGPEAQTTFSFQLIFTRGAVTVDPSISLLSPLPSILVVDRRVLAASGVYALTQAISQPTAIKEFTFGGRGYGEGMFGRYVAATEEYVPGGNFESSGDVALWTDTSIGDSAPLVPTYSTAQAYTGTGSLLFANGTKTGANDYPEITYTWSSNQSLDSWRYVTARFYNDVPVGGAVTRTISIRLTDNVGTVRVYSVSGLTNAAPFNAVGWIQILGEIRIPTSQVGTTFDINNVVSISLRLQDSANKAFTAIYWDTVKFVGALDIVQKIYTNGNTTAIQFDPIVSFTAGEVMYLALRNNDASSKEFQLTVAGVDLT